MFRFFFCLKDFILSIVHSISFNVKFLIFDILLDVASSTPHFGNVLYLITLVFQLLLVPLESGLPSWSTSFSYPLLSFLAYDQDLL